MNNSSMPPQGPSIIEEHQKRTCCAHLQRATRRPPATNTMTSHYRHPEAAHQGRRMPPPLPPPLATDARHDPLTHLSSSQWKVLILDATTKDLVSNTVKEDDILNQNIASMLRLVRNGGLATLMPCRHRDDRGQARAKPHHGRHLLSRAQTPHRRVPPRRLPARRLQEGLSRLGGRPREGAPGEGGNHLSSQNSRYKSPNTQLSPLTYTGTAVWETLLIDYFPRESHVVTFRDPWSFPILFHPACNEMVKNHLEALAHKVRKPASRYRTT